MAVDFPATLPSWKLDLIERKRRQELDPAGPRVSSDLGSDAATLPPLKQDILFRKHQKSLTGTDGLEDEIRPSPAGIFLSPGDGKECGGTVVDQRDLSLSLEAIRESPPERGPGLCADGEIPLEDRLPPVHLNPFFLMDLENRGGPPTVAILNANDSHRPVKQSGLRDSGLHDFDADGADDSTIEDLRCDEIQNEEEVTYGKGFVNRLLQKFSCLSGREEVSPVRSHFPRTFSRQQSNNDLFDDFYKSGSRSKRPQMKRTNSLDDLLRESAFHSEPENCRVVNDTEGECGVRWSSRGTESRVLSVKNIFEGLAKLPTTSANSWALHNQHPTSPRLYEKSDVSDSARIRELQAENSEDFRDGVVQNCLDSSHVMHDKNFDTAAHHHAINDNMRNSFGCRASLPPPTENKLTTVTDVGVYLGEENNRNDKSAVQVSKCKTDVLAYLIDLPEKNSTNDRFVAGSLRDVVNSATSELMSSNLSTGLPQTRQEIKVQVSPRSLPDQNNSDHSEPVKLDRRAKNAPSSADSTAVKKPLPRPGLLLIRPASNLANVRSNGPEKMTKYNDIRDGEFLPAKIAVRKSVPSGDSDPDEFEELVDASKYLRTVRFEFEGAGICLERSLLSKSKKGAQLKIAFDDATTSVYEYPSEQSVIDSWPVDFVEVDHGSGQHNTQATFGTVLGSGQPTFSAGPSNTEVDLSSGINVGSVATTSLPSTISQDNVAECYWNDSDDKVAV